MSNSVTPARSDAPDRAVFAPGHLGELTWQVPVELVDAVLAETKITQRRLRDLPSRVGVYFVLACCLFPALGCRKVWAKLTATLRGRKAPSEKAFRDLRRRIGAAPMRALFEVLAGLVAVPQDLITARLAAIAENRAVIEQAKGVLMAIYGIAADRAFEILGGAHKRPTSNFASWPYDLWPLSARRTFRPKAAATSTTHCSR